MDPRERDSLFRELEHSDEEVRRLAVERLSELRPEEALAPLVERLGDTSWRVRKAAIERLTARGDVAELVHALLGALADGENSGRRNAALEALTRVGVAAVPGLVEASHSHDIDVRKQTVDALAAIASPGAAARLVELLGDDDANVRAAAAEAIGAAEAREVSDALRAAASTDAEPLVRLSALRSLARLEVALPTRDLLPALADPLLRAAACALLGSSDDPSAIAELEKLLASPARSAREAAMEALVRQAQLAPPGEDVRLFERLRESHADASFLPDALVRLAEAPLVTRLVLVQFLGWLGRADCVVPLLEAGCDDALTEVVLGVLRAAGSTAETQVESSWPALSPPARRVACALLGRTRGETGEVTLRRALESAEPPLRGAAARALAERGARAALPALVIALRAATSQSSEVDDTGPASALEVEDAIRSLLGGAERVYADRVGALLEAEIEGAPEPFRLATARLLGAAGASAHRERVELLLSDPSAAVRRAAIEALARLAPDCLEPLRCALADESPLVRIGATLALAASGDPAAVADLASAMEDHEPRVAAAALRGLAAWVRAAANEEARGRALLLLSVGLAHGGAAGLAALDSLTAIGGEDAVALARSALTSAEPELAEAAVACIGRHGNAAALATLVPLLAAAHWNVRARVARVLEERRQVHAMPALIRQLESERDEFVRAAILTALATLESL